MSGSLGEREMLWENKPQASVSTAISSSPKLSWAFLFNNNIRLRARVFYEQILNEAQPSWLSLVENEGE